MNVCFASTSKCLPVGGKGGLRRATSVKSGHALGWTSGGSGGEGTASIGSWYRGGCTVLSTGMLGPRIQLAITSQQPQKNSERPWRRPRCRLRKSTGFTNAWMYAICRVTCKFIKILSWQMLANAFPMIFLIYSLAIIHLVWKKKKERTWKTLSYGRGESSNSNCAPESKAHPVRVNSTLQKFLFDRLKGSGAYLVKRMKQKNLLIKVIKVCDII